MKQKTGDVLRSASRLLHVLEWFSEDRPEGTAGEIARDLDIAPATVRRLLTLLETHRFVQRDPASGSYRVGVAPLRLASIVRGSDPIARASREELDRLEDELGELLFVGILDGTDVVHIEVRESAHQLRIHPATRRVKADEGGATGKVLLAWKEAEDVAELFAGEYEGAAGKRRLAELEAALTQVRTRGYGLTAGPTFEGRWAVATPIRDLSGEVTASLCIAAPSVRATKTRQRELISHAQRSAATISARLGWTGSARGT